MKLRTWVSGILGGILLAGCSSTPRPTGDQVTSVSWVNATPYPMTLVTTRICGKENILTLEELPPYTESARRANLALTRNCGVKVEMGIGATRLPGQTAWIPDPRIPTADRNYHLRIQLVPHQPPGLSLEVPETARARIQAAGRRIDDAE